MIEWKIKMSYFKFEEYKEFLYQKAKKQFINDMNIEIVKLEGYEIGMSVCADENGYWLEKNNQKQEDVISKGLLSSARKLTIEA